ncbi:MAG TPA: carboxypeptidase-like regulatory domain-containing protein [Gemmatimonadaceae bacterium]|nr:carboxypeptidase-like regulatory domain-containing protein [Gemmatimonadaceae bacterium]
MAYSTLLLSALSLVLQDPGGAVRGTIVDAGTGRPLHGATVALTDLNRSAATDAHGAYRFAAVPPGPQHLTARYLGYAPRTVHALVPSAGDVAISIGLAPLPRRLTTVVIRREVPAAAGSVRDAARTPDRAMSIHEIRRHPLLAEPDVLEAIAGGGVAVEPEAPSGVHIDGAAADQTAYLLDGIPIFSPYHAAGVFGAFNPDAIDDIAVWSGSVPPDHVAAVGGVVAARTRRPDRRWSMQGSAGSAQARLTVDGPIGAAPGSALIALRTGFPGAFPSAGDDSRIQGAGGDRIIAASAKARGGVVRALYYDNENELSVASDTASVSSAPRHTFEWQSRSGGGEWQRTSGPRRIALRVWNADAATRIGWRADSGGYLDLAATRRDVGVLASLGLTGARSITTALVRLERIRTTVTERDSARETPVVLRGGPTVMTLGLEHDRPVGSHTRVQLHGGAALAGDAVFLSPALAVRWEPVARATVRLSAGRRHQFAQSLRNDESIVGTVFPAEVYAAAERASGVPVARGEHVTLSVDVQADAATGVGVHAYARRSRGLVLSAASGRQPFAIHDLATGSARAWGATVQASRSTRRYAVLASYGWQHTTVRHPGGSYTPRHSARHRIDAGIMGYPGSTLSLRVGTIFIAGRRATPAIGAVEWESCNLLDLGCEFAGSPTTSPREAGSVRLPAYLRVDLGARKHWHVQLASRDLTLAAFVTVTNLVGRANTLVYASDPASGDRFPVTMRPLAPLVAGIDWRF